MSATDVIKTALERNWGMVDRALEGLDDATLARQPNSESNSIAWLLWHMTRVVDRFINTQLQTKTQLWIQDGWHQKFGMSDDDAENGRGWSQEQVAAWVAPPRDVLLGYYQATTASAREYLANLSDADLDSSVTPPPANEPRPVHEMLGIMVYDNVVHGGQIAYLRGYFGGLGWFV
ncbi:MAG: DinB family protein [Chloroflexi bacterium]|nr:DinB family protein [Chloroflexota bacterium]